MDQPWQQPWLCSSLCCTRGCTSGVAATWGFRWTQMWVLLWNCELVPDRGEASLPFCREWPRARCQVLILPLPVFTLTHTVVNKSRKRILWVYTSKCSKRCKHLLRNMSTAQQQTVSVVLVCVCVFGSKAFSVWVSICIRANFLSSKPSLFFKRKLEVINGQRSTKRNLLWEIFW